MSLDYVLTDLTAKTRACLEKQAMSMTTIASFSVPTVDTNSGKVAEQWRLWLVV
jgi:hypothetical protein